MKTFPIIKCIAFDLDDTLIDTTNLIVPVVVKNSYQALKEAGLKISFDEFNQLRKSMTAQHSHKEIFKILAHKYHIDDSLKIQKSIDAFYKPEIKGPLPVFPEALGNLEQLKAKYTLYLVTSGDPKTQKMKIEATGTEKYFKNIYIPDSLKGERKRDFFHNIIQDNQIQPSALLSFGNRLCSEIRDAKSCGATTCYFAYGEHLGEQPEQPEDYPDYTITTHKDFISTCHL